MAAFLKDQLDPEHAARIRSGLVYGKVNKGTGVVIRFGSKGAEQYAHCVVSRYTMRGNTIRVRCWRAASKSWTKPRRLDPAECIRIATADDAVKFKPDFGLAWDR